MSRTHATLAPTSTARELVSFLETGVAAPGLFTADAFCDLTLPLWRRQAWGRDDVVALRTSAHPAPSRVSCRRLDVTGAGFVLEVEERWDADGESWYCRELMRADVRDGGIAELSVYCTGDWDRARVAEHAAAVTLVRP